MSTETKQALTVIGGIFAFLLLVIAFYAYGIPFLFHSSVAWDKYLLRVMGS